MNNVKIFGKRLRELRIENGMTKAQLATLLNITPPAVTLLENGIYSSSSYYVLRASEIFQVSMDYLVGLKETREFS